MQVGIHWASDNFKTSSASELMTPARCLCWNLSMKLTYKQLLAAPNRNLYMLSGKSDMGGTSAFPVDSGTPTQSGQMD